MSFDRLIQRSGKPEPTVVGLDPKLSYVPAYLQKRYLDEDGESRGRIRAIFKFIRRSSTPSVTSFRRSSRRPAYYEMYGHHGIKTLERTIRYAKLKGMFVITDGKRNDIGATMEAYTAAHLGSCKVGENECPRSARTR